METGAIFLQNLVKKYGDKSVINDITLSIPKGLIFGLLGPNGAGKSSVINIISGILKQTSGEVFILGKSTSKHLNECKMQIGTALQEVLLDPFFSVQDYLTFMAGYYGLNKVKGKQRIEEVCYALGLTEHLYKNTRMLSGGMKRRLIIAKAILHDPEILILDEPTAGVDIELRASLWKYVQELNRKGKTIILTTHYLEEAESFCDNIAFIQNGKIILNDTKHNILKQINTKKVSILVDKLADFNLPEGFIVTHRSVEDGILIELSYNHVNFKISEFFKALQFANIEIKDIWVKDPNLDDIFLSVFKNHA